jgi:EAL and modified HD-GYP domain-containing signal transduction protein
MDDFVYHDRYLPLLRLTDIIKVDFLSTAKEVRKDLVKKLKPLGVAFLAEKIETQDMFEEAVDLGYTYCQGYFFSRPKIVTGKDIPGFKLNYLRLLQEIHRPDLDFGKLEEIIRGEVSLSYKLLRYINSPFFGRKDEISSLKQALLLLGEKETIKWLTLVILASMGEDKPQELVAQSLFRAKFCEPLAPLVGLLSQKESLFLLGLFSMIDALLDRPLPEILAEIPIAEEIKGALLGENNRLRKVFQYVLSYEKGEWNTLADIGLRGLSDEKVSRLYLEAVRGLSFTP